MNVYDKEDLMHARVEIEVDIPKGWKAVAFRRPKKGEMYVDTASAVEVAEHDFNHTPCMIVEKEKPVRRVFEFTGEVRRARPDELIGTKSGICLWDGRFPTVDEYEIWKEVTEE